MVFLRDFAWKPERRALAGSWALGSTMAMYFGCTSNHGKLVSGELRPERATMLCASTN